MHPRLLKDIANVLENYTVKRLGRFRKIPDECRRVPGTQHLQKVTAQNTKGLRTKLHKCQEKSWRESF